MSEFEIQSIAVVMPEPAIPSRVEQQTEQERQDEVVQTPDLFEGSVNLITNKFDWMTNSGANSTANIVINKEVIDGEEKDVMTININLSEWEWAGIMNHHQDIIRQLREGSGVRFKVLGNGKRWWISFAIPETSGTGGDYGLLITTRNRRVVEVDIPFSQLRQPNWYTGSRTLFDKNSITGLHIERNWASDGVSGNSATGRAVIKIFDLEIY